MKVQLDEKVPPYSELIHKQKNTRKTEKSNKNIICLSFLFSLFFVLSGIYLLNIYRTLIKKKKHLYRITIDSYYGVVYLKRL